MLRNLIVLVTLAGLSSAALAKGGGLEGVVHDAKSQPVAGAWLEVRHVEHGALTAGDFEVAPFRSVRSDADGRWAFADLGDGLWLVTAVATSEPRTDEELQQLARPGADGRTPAGAAVSRLVRRLPVEQNPAQIVGLAGVSVPTWPLFGKLAGPFDPDRFAYEVRVTPATVTPDGTSVTTITNGTSATQMPTFSTVPDREGRFDFGPLDVSHGGWLSVETIPLAAAWGPGGTVLGQELLTFEPWKGAVRIPLPGKATTTLKAISADGQPVALATGEKITFTVWDSHGLETSWYANESAISKSFSEDTYVVRATMGDFASPATPLTVDASGGPAEVALSMQPCPAFVVHLVDAKGAPISRLFLKLGTEATRSLPKPCRISAACQGGDVKLEGVLPGNYDVEFKDFGKPTFTQRVELKPGGVPLVVTMATSDGARVAEPSAPTAARRSEAEVLKLADEFAKARIDLKSYPERSATYDPKSGKWRVFYERVPIRATGDHFTIEVDDKSDEMSFIGGA